MRHFKQRTAIEAVRWDGANFEEVAPIFNGHLFGVRWAESAIDRVLTFKNPAGASFPDVEVKVGLWVLRERGALKVLNHETFVNLYEPV